MRAIHRSAMSTMSTILSLILGLSVRLADGVPHEFSIDPAVSAELLRCWTCNQTVNCRDMYDLTGVTSTICRLDEAFCAIITYETVSGDVTYARGCQKNCRPDCHHINKSYDKMKCFSCCSNSLCNSDRDTASYTNSLSKFQLWIAVFILKIFSSSYVE